MTTVYLNNRDGQITDEFANALYEMIFNSYLAVVVELADVPDAMICDWKTESKRMGNALMSTDQQASATVDRLYRIGTNLRRIRRLDCSFFLVKLQSDNGEVYVSIHIDGPKASKFPVSILRVNERDTIIDFRLITVSILESGSVNFTNTLNSAVYFGGKNAQKMSRVYKALDLTGMCPFTLWDVVEKSVDVIAQKKPDQYCWTVGHSDLYMEVAKFIRGSYPASFERVDQIYNPNNCDMTQVYTKTVHTDEEPEIMNMDESTLTKYPMINLSKKEIQWVRKYCEPYIFGGISYPFIKAISECRFGNTLRVATDLPDGHGNRTQKELTVNYFVLPDGSVKFTIREILRPGIGVCSFVFYEKPEHVPHEPDIIKISMIINRGTELPQYPEVLDDSVLIANKSLGTMSAVMAIIHMLIVIRDRPTKYNTMKQYKTRTKPNVHHEHPKDEEVVVHVLQNSARIRATIKEASNKERAQYRYVVPEWTRRAHDIRLRNGTVVHRKEQICHRHKDLSTNEVVLKL